MPGEVIAEGEVRVGINDAEVRAGLAKLDADFKRSMAAIDRSHAEAKVTADISQLDRKIAEAKRRLDELKARSATATIDADKKQFDKDAAAVEAELKKLNGQKATLKIDSKQLRDANRLAAISSKRQAEMARQFERTSRAEAKAAEVRRKMSADTVKATADIDKLRERYNKLANEEQRIARKTGRPGGIFHTESERLGLQKLRSEMALTEHKIRDLGGSIDDITPDLEDNENLFRRWGNSISHVRFQMGFFSATLRQLAIGFVALGPIITGLLGSLASLVGVAGTGLAGAMAAASAGLGGFVLTAAGIGLVLKPAIDDFKAAQAASKAYNDAILKYGKGSEEARTAQEKLNQTLKGVSPAAREAIESAGGISDKWSELTKGARVPIFDAIGQGIKTVQALMPSFAKQTVASTKAVTQGWERWMQALRSPGAKEGLNELMSNFRQSLPSLMSGFQSLATMMGRISVSASKLLPGLSKGFSSWARSLMGSVGAGDQLDAKVERLVTHMRDIGHLAQASGRLMINFFNTGADSGDDMVKSLTKTLNTWNKWVTSVAGQRSLTDFFAQANSETSQLFSSLGRLTQLLFQLGRATAPLSDGFLKVLTAIGDVVAAASQLNGVNEVLKAVGVTLASIWVVGKVKAFSNAVMGAARSLGILAAAEEATLLATGASGAAGAAGGGGGLLSRIFGRGGAGTATRSLTALEEAMGGAAAGSVAARGGITALGGAVSTVSLVAIPVGIAALGAYKIATSDMSGAAGEFADKSSEAAAVVVDSIHKQSRADQELTHARQKSIDSADKRAQAEKHLAKVVKESGLGSPKAIHAAQELAKARDQELDAAEKQYNVAQKRAQLEKGIKNKAQGQLVLAKAAVALAKGTDGEAEAFRRLHKAESLVAEADRRVAFSHLNLSRIQSGLQPLTMKLADSFSKLKDNVGAAAAKKVGKIVNPQDVAQVTNLSNRLSKLGQASTVKKVLVKSQGADETIGKLQKLQRQSAQVTQGTKRLTVRTDDRQASTQLTRLARLSQKVTGAKNTVKIMANSSSAEEAISRLRGHLEAVAKRKYQARLDAIDNATPKGSAARKNLEGAAKRRYQARLDAIDNATRVAQKAKSAFTTFAHGQYKASLIADPSQALAGVAAAKAAIESVHDRTVHINVVTTRTGKAEGGEADQMSAEYRRQLRMQESAPVRPNVPQEVRRPTMLVGEQGPGYPEWVIAQNPAYRQRNEAYLEAAASEFGFMLVPGHKAGLQNRHKAHGKGGGGGRNDDPYRDLLSGKKPKEQHGKHYYMRHDKFAPKSVHELNQLENVIELKERQYNAELSREEQEIAHHKRDHWDFGLLKGFLTDERNSSFKIERQVIPNIEKAANTAKNKANKALSGPLSASSVHGAEKSANQLGKEYSSMRQGKNETDGHYARRKAEKKADVTVAKENAKRLKKERENAQTIAREAQEQLNELHQEVAGVRKVQREEVETEIQNINDIEGNPELAPYYEAPEESASEKAGKEGPTIGEQTATLSAARQELYSQFASNIAGQVTPQSFGVKVSGAGAVAASGNGAVSQGIMPAALVHKLGIQGAGSSAGTASTGKFTTVNNHFAAPPPDPHTWARQQQFELGALA